MPPELDFDMQFKRTISLVKELLKGRTLTLPTSGQVVGMSEFGDIGIMYGGGVSPFTFMTLRQLNDLLEKEGVGFIVPSL